MTPYEMYLEAQEQWEALMDRHNLEIQEEIKRLVLEWYNECMEER